MLEKISEKITNRLIRKKAISHDDRDIYKYGLEQLITAMADIVSIIILGIIFGEPAGSVVFLIAFMSLRSYSGGYHASTPTKCYVLTVLATCAVLSVMKFAHLNSFICIGLLIVTSAIILLLSPVESENKRLDGIEKKVYRRKSIFIWCIGTIVFIVAVIAGIKVIFASIVLAYTVIAVSMLAGNIKLAHISSQRNN